MKETGEGDWVGDGDIFANLSDSGGGFLPPFVQDWLGVHDMNPDLKVSGGYTPASALNDQGFDFNYIADAIERTYLTVPTTPTPQS
jgi:hypothetical protein